MNKKYFSVRRLTMALLLAILTITVSACADNTGGTTNGADNQVAGAAQELIYGYVLDVNEQARTITIDEVELVNADNTDRLNQIGVDATSFDGDNYAYNERRSRNMLPLSRYVDFDLNNNDQNGTNGTTNSTNNAVTNNGGSMTDRNTNTNTAYDIGGISATDIPNNAMNGNNNTVNGDGNNSNALNGNNGNINNNTTGNNSTVNNNSYDNNTGSGYDNNTLYSGMSDYDRLTGITDDNAKNLFLFIIENGYVVNIRDANYLL